MKKIAKYLSLTIPTSIGIVIPFCTTGCNDEHQYVITFDNTLDTTVGGNSGTGVRLDDKELTGRGYYPYVDMSKSECRSNETAIVQAQMVDDIDESHFVAVQATGVSIGTTRIYLTLYILFGQNDEKLFYPYIDVTIS